MTKRMTLETELIFYNLAIEDYLKAWNGMADTNILIATQSGFCLYFRIRHKLDFSEVTTLWKRYTKEAKGAYWFEKGQYLPRCNQLLASKKIVERKIKKLQKQNGNS